MFEAKRWHELILPLGIIACLLVILVPLPPMLLDLLLAANITIAVIILLTTIQVKTPLEFAIFPTLLLATTLGRVVLNIATTRLILSNGATENAAAAGGVIQSFGEFVAGNQIAVGIIIFAIIVVVQFVVITKGATRISEVAARFALDGMPGRQMAIDADLNAGAIDAQQASTKRVELQQQADFYGAMDGASKFVRGDAIAGITITAINIFAGLGIGLSQGMSIAQATETFTKLTIGDGLATQIPGLLVALAAGILISRSTKSSNLPSEFISQLFTRPQVLMIAGVFLFVLVFTQLPALPLITVGGICVGLAIAITRREAEQKRKTESEQQNQATAPQNSDDKVNRFLAIDPLEIELGVNLIDMARGGQLLKKIKAARDELAQQRGIVLPKVRVHDNLQLGNNEFQIRVNQIPVCVGSVEPNRMLVLKRTADARAPGGIPVQWHDGQEAFWVKEESFAEVDQNFRVLSPADVVVDTLKHQCRQRAPEILTRQSTAYLIDQLRETNPTTVDELIPDVMRIGEVQQVLQILLAEGVTIRPLNTILEALADHRNRARDLATLTELVRRRLAPWISSACSDAHGVLKCLRLDPQLQAWLEQRVVFEDGQYTIRLDSAARRRLVEAILLEKSASLRLPLVVSPVLRPALHSLLTNENAPCTVISQQEISRDVKIETIAILRLEDVHYAAA